MLHVNPVSTQPQTDGQSGHLILGPAGVSTHRANLSLSLDGHAGHVHAIRHGIRLFDSSAE